MMIKFFLGKMGIIIALSLYSMEFEESYADFITLSWKQSKQTFMLNLADREPITYKCWKKIIRKNTAQGISTAIALVAASTKYLPNIQKSYKKYVYAYDAESFLHYYFNLEQRIDPTCTLPITRFGVVFVKPHEKQSFRSLSFSDLRMPLISILCSKASIASISTDNMRTLTDKSNLLARLWKPEQKLLTLSMISRDDFHQLRFFIEDKCPLNTFLKQEPSNHFKLLNDAAQFECRTLLDEFFSRKDSLDALIEKGDLGAIIAGQKKQHLSDFLHSNIPEIIEKLLSSYSAIPLHPEFLRHLDCHYFNQHPSIHGILQTFKKGPLTLAHAAMLVAWVKINSPKG